MLTRDRRVSSCPDTTTRRWRRHNYGWTTTLENQSGSHEREWSADISDRAARRERCEAETERRRAIFRRRILLRPTI